MLAGALSSSIMLGATVLLTFILFYLPNGSAGMAHLTEVLRRSGEGDLSSPANVPGPREVTIFGTQLDAAQVDLLESWVSEEAGGLILVAGPVQTGGDDILAGLSGCAGPGSRKQVLDGGPSDGAGEGIRNCRLQLLE